MLDIRPPAAPLLAAFGHPVLAEVTLPGGAPTTRPVIWYPPTAVFENIADAAVLDTMQGLSIKLADDGSELGLPVGTRVVVPPPGSLEPRVWTVRKLDNSTPPDFEWAHCRVAE